MVAAMAADPAVSVQSALRPLTEALVAAPVTPQALPLELVPTTQLMSRPTRGPSTVAAELGSFVWISRSLVRVCR